jgi:hypothetical protein
MLRKLVIFLITSGLAKRAYEAYRAKLQTAGPAQIPPKRPTHRAATVSASHTPTLPPAVNHRHE